MDFVSLLPFAVVGLMLLWLMLRQLRERQLRGQAKGWPSAEGKILTATTQMDRQKNRELWSVRVTYSFTSKEGSCYGGEARFGVDGRADAEGLVQDLKEATVDVRYRSADPDVSLITTADGRVGERLL
jgi:hypothetical protein